MYSTELFLNKGHLRKIIPDSDDEDSGHDSMDCALHFANGDDDLDEDGSPSPERPWSYADEDDEGGRVDEDNSADEGEAQGQDAVEDEYNDSGAEPLRSFPCLHDASADSSGDVLTSARRASDDADEPEVGSDDECEV